jgi:hypothetical protein
MLTFGGRKLPAAIFLVFSPGVDTMKSICAVQRLAWQTIRTSKDRAASLR